MPDSQLSNELASQLEHLCERIAGCDEAAAETRRELKDHVEQKARGYLSGEIALSDQDVFLLVERHFGDEQRLRSMLDRAHGWHALMRAAPHVARRMAAATLAIVAASLVQQLFCLIARFAIVPFAQDEPYQVMAEACAYFLSFGMATVTFIWFLLSWSKRLWHLRIGALNLTVIAIGAIVLRWLAGYVFPASRAQPFPINLLQLDWVPACRLVAVAGSLVCAIAWIAWTDRWPRTYLSVPARIVVAVIGFLIVPIVLNTYGIAITGFGWPIGFRMQFRPLMPVFFGTRTWANAATTGTLLWGIYLLSQPLTKRFTARTA